MKVKEAIKELEKQNPEAELGININDLKIKTKSSIKNGIQIDRVYSGQADEKSRIEHVLVKDVKNDRVLGYDILLLKNINYSVNDFKYIMGL